MNTLPSISEHIDQNTINKVIEDNFAALAPSFYTLASNWFVRAYDHYKDIDKFVIIIYLINQDLIYFRQNGVKIDYDTFYKDKSIEIKKINISDISKDLDIPKESVRRKVLELEKSGTIKRSGKKIFIVRDTLYSVRATNTLTELATILHEFNKILKIEKLATEVYSINEIISAMKENFSYCWYQFNKFWFIYIGRWREELKDLEVFTIGMVVLINAIKNTKFTPKKPDINSYRKEIMGSDKRGVNAMSIADITGIPRPTVVRKLKYLIDKKFVTINEKKLISYNEEFSRGKKTDKLLKQNMLSLSYFIYKIFNQIRIINP